MIHQTGDTVRVLTHNPHGSRLLAGDEVRVRTVKSDAEDREVLLVETDNGLRALYADDVEMVSAAYRPAVPDPQVDEEFLTLLNADPELVALFEHADTALGAVDEELSDALIQPDEDGNVITAEHVDGHGVIGFTKPADDETSVLTLTDPWGDSAVFVYQEAEAPDGTTLGRIMVWTDCEAGVSVRHYIPDLIAWLQEKHDRTA